MREVDDADEPLLVLGGGLEPRPRRRRVRRAPSSRSRRAGSRSTPPTCAAARTSRVAAGEDWDGFVARAVGEGWSGIEALSGIPGSTGATPVQNVGAYGQEVAQTIARVRVWDRLQQQVRTLMTMDCRFTYRHSLFKGTDRYVVLDVMFQLRPAVASRSRSATPTSPPSSGVAVGDRVPLGRRARGRPRAAPPARAWCSTPPTTTRGAAGRSSPTRSSREADFEALRERVAERLGADAPAPPRLPRRQRRGEVERRVAHRAGRLRQGLRPARSGCPVHQAHPRRDQPRRGDDLRRPGPRPHRARRRARRPSASPSSTSPSSSARPSDDTAGSAAPAVRSVPRLTMPRPDA